MQIEWFTVVAQVVNLFILLWLLQHFLYRPVLDAMQRRQQNVNTALAEAANRSASAELEKQRLEQEQAELANQRQSLLLEMRNDVQNERQAEMEKLRKEIAQQGRGWQEDIARDKSQFLTSMRSSVTGMTRDIARKVLKDVADVELQDQLVRVFIRKFADLQDSEKQQLLEGPINVETSFELDEKRQQVLANALLGKPPERAGALNYSTSPTLLCGIAVRSPTYAVRWDIASYLDEFDTRMSDWFSQANLEATDKADVCTD